ncbi:MAG: glycosyltransferase family 2 protein [candidate division KSB1 bacterium]|nr:glycosyltransferase family 2 protein [candidate division KSB1 bacterium]
MAEVNRRRLAIILIGTDGLAPFLGPCLESLPAACDGLPYRVLIVDNDGNGITSQLAEAYSGKMPLSILQQPRPKGFAANVNDALRHVDEPFVLLLNVDTQVPPGSLRRVVEIAESDPAIGALGVRMVGRDGKVQSSARAYPYPSLLLWEEIGIARAFPRSWLFGRYRDYFVSRDHPMEVDWVSGAFMLLRTQALRTVRGMDEGFFLYSEDTDLCYRLRECGWRVVFDPSITIFHWKDPLRYERRRFTFVQTHRSLLRFWKKHGSTARQIAVRLVLAVGMATRLLTSPLLLRRGLGYFRESVLAFGETFLLLLGYKSA